MVMVKGERLMVKAKRQNTFGRIILILCLLSFVLSPIQAQSNVTYTVRVGATDRVALLDTFPELYQAEKLNVRVQLYPITNRNTDSLDFIFTNRPMLMSSWGDSIYSFTDESETEWTVWRNRAVSKNRIQCLKY